MIATKGTSGVQLATVSSKAQKVQIAQIATKGTSGVQLGDSQFKGTDSHKGQLDVLLFFKSVSRSWTLALVTLVRAAE